MILAALIGSSGEQTGAHQAPLSGASNLQINNARLQQY
jgi:hypothetical protein